MEFPLCSIIVVNFNGKKYLDACLQSFEQLDYPAEKVEILLVDNGSEDGSELEAQSNHPQVRLLRNPKNNFAAALNLGTAQSRGSYIAFANNDVFVEREWLARLVKTLEANPRAGCAGGKILFDDGRINSVGHRALPDFYWEDEGYNQEDRGQYEIECERVGLCWAAVLFRKSCLSSLGPIDEDFVLYYEDVDTSLRCRQQGWKVLYTPKATARHVFHGSSQGSRLTDYFIDRGRLIYVAKHHPESLARTVENSRFIAQQALEALYDNLPIVLKKLMESHPPKTVERVLEELCQVLVRLYGSLAVDHLMARMQVILGYRKMSAGFYDQALHVIGGGQKYGCSMAAAIRDRFDVTLIASHPVTLPDLESWYGLSLSGCELKQLPIPFFDRFGAWIDSNVVTRDIPNPFEIVSASSQGFDIFVIVNMLTMVRPLSPFSIFFCHFPDALRRCYFAVDEYCCLIVSSRYAAQWVRTLWGLEPTVLVYPSVDMAGPAEPKENIILSVARFELGGSKKQRELIEAFAQLRATHPDLMRSWRLVLVGGSMSENPYLQEIQRLVRKSSAPIEVRVNVSLHELRGWYARAKIFWHACGLGETNPHLVEHFGMTTVEAMQNRCVPIVINGGGQREIVEHGKSGFRFDTLTELCLHTQRVIEDGSLMERLAAGAFARSQLFSRESFENFLRQFFHALAEEYRTIQLPDPRDILRNRLPTSLFYSSAAHRARPPFPPAVEPSGFDDLR